MEVSEPQKDINLDEDVKKKNGEKAPQQEPKKTGTKKTKGKADKFEAIKKLFKQETEKLKKEIDAKEKEAKENFDKFLRLNAEFDNFKKRTERGKADSFKYASEKIIRDMIPVVDDLERALQAAKSIDKGEEISKGVEMILNQIKSILESNGAKQFDSLGQIFDPNKHEAVSKIATAEHDNNTIIEELGKGYMLHDRLLRPAIVVVAENISEKKEEKEIKTEADKEEDKKEVSDKEKVVK